jgi:ABC-type bacteriocin/lantibiotic exporter with double-glycine peptidase domain
MATNSYINGHATHQAHHGSEHHGAGHHAGAHHAGERQGGAHQTHQSTTSELLKKLFYLLAQERRDIWVLVTYSVISGLLGLVVPLSSQAIVNTVQLGVVTPQLIILCLAVGLGMILLGIFTLLEAFLIDLLQRRLFVRAALEIATRLPKISMEALDGEYAPELVNRFFDVITIQKSLSKLLLDGLSAALVALVGLFLLAIYHPLFIIFDFALLFFALIVIFVLSYGGMATSIKESKKKYALVEWLEEIARSHSSFKLYSTEAFIMQRVDYITSEYVLARKKHFHVLARQLMGSTIFRAIASVGILGLGGFLVIQQDLSIGQLVAAEIVIISVLNSIDKLISQFDIFYDLLTAVDKMSHITDKELEPVNGEVYNRRFSPASLRFHNVRFAYPDGTQALNNLSFELPASSHASVIGGMGAGKTTITQLLSRMYEAQSGSIMLNGYELRHIRLQDSRSAVGVVTTQLEIFNGSVQDNILLGRAYSHEDLVWATQTVLVYEEIIALPQGFNTNVQATGVNLSESLLCRIMIARAIVGKPQLLVIDEALHTLDEYTKLNILDALYSCEYWTIVDISNDIMNIRRSDLIIGLHDGALAEMGKPSDLASDKSSIFSQLFPELSRSLRVN